VPVELLLNKDLTVKSVPEITPRLTRLFRVSNLQSFQNTIADLLVSLSPSTTNDTVVLVPTSAAGVQLSRTIQVTKFKRETKKQDLKLPEFLSRSDWYLAMLNRLVPTEKLLSDIERNVCMWAAIRTAGESEILPPFKVRPGLLPAVVAFYDQLMRLGRSIDSFHRLMVTELEPNAGFDRGASSLLRQTHFLSSAFRNFKDQISKIKKLDEHELRAKLLKGQMVPPFERVIVTISDHVAEPDGLWPTDFDLLTRLPGIKNIDVIATDEVLDAGFYERLYDLLPGIESRNLVDNRHAVPVLISPESTDQNYFVCRDREEELLLVARAVKSGSSRLKFAQKSVLFQVPLPYLYLARQVFDQAEIPFEMKDSLPLAAESYAANLDLIFDFILSNYSRPALIGLLRSPYFNFSLDSHIIDKNIVEKFDRALYKERYSGGHAALSQMVVKWNLKVAHPSSSSYRDPELISVLEIVEALAADFERLRVQEHPSKIIKGITDFLSKYEAGKVEDVLADEREQRAKIRIREILEALYCAHKTLDDTPVDCKTLFMSVRRWIETEMFLSRDVIEGIQLLDARAARYGRFNEMFLVGLVSDEWPERIARSVFYPNALLVSLGWPRAAERVRAARARFMDLLRLPTERVLVTTFSLEDDSITAPSIFLEQLENSDLEIVREDIDRDKPVTFEEILVNPKNDLDDFIGERGSWLDLRRRLPDRNDSYRGVVGSSKAQSHSVSDFQTYIDCPFKYFSRRELALKEETSEELGVTARFQGDLLHSVLEKFFCKWQAKGNQVLTQANRTEAVSVFSTIVEESIKQLSIGERAVMRTWFLGSAGASGIIDRLYLSESDTAFKIIQRSCEHIVSGDFVLQGKAQTKEARLRGKIDRLDFLSDGSLRIIDYKLNRAPDRKHNVQLPLYSKCIEQQFKRDEGKECRVKEAAYIEFGTLNSYRPLKSQDLVAGEVRAIEILDDITQGVFPIQPINRRRCNTCSYSTVCRKEFRGD
tara:strand:+ start:22469 stop:25453 length:2985 start_codon:yes stop_codon:yes gene_type:complete